MSNYVAIIPIVSVVLSATAADARRGLPPAGRAHAALRARADRPGRRGGLVGHAVGHRRAQLRRRPRRQLRALHQPHPLRRRRPDDAVLDRGGRAGRAAAGRVLRADAVRPERHDADGRGDRPAGHLPRARGAVAVGLRADRPPPGRAPPAPKRRSSTSCWARSRARSSSTASRSPSPSPARPGSTSSASALSAQGAGGAVDRSRSWRSACSRSDSRSRSPRCRSTCGRRTPTRARRRSSRRSCPPASRPPPSPRSCACSSSPLEPLKAEWVPVLSVIAAATMILGTVVGVRPDQRQADARVLEHRARRLPAARASSPTTATGKAAVLFYLLSYAVTNLGALGIVALLGTPDSTSTTSCAISPGCGGTRPGLAGLMTMFLLSLGGFPPTAGFIGKWYIFAAAVERGYYWLAIIGVLTSVVSVFFYLRIIVMMYMTEGSETARPRVPAAAMAGLALAMLAVLYLGVLPTQGHRPRARLDRDDLLVSEGLRPSDSPTRSLTRRFVGAFRSRGSLRSARSRSRLFVHDGFLPRTSLHTRSRAASSARSARVARFAPLASRSRLFVHDGFLPRTSLHARSRAASSARSARVARFAPLASRSRLFVHDGFLPRTSLDTRSRAASSARSARVARFAPLASRSRLFVHDGFLPRTSLHTRSRAASSARSARVARFAPLARAVACSCATGSAPRFPTRSRCSVAT